MWLLGPATLPSATCQCNAQALREAEAPDAKQAVTPNSEAPVAHAACRECRQALASHASADAVLAAQSSCLKRRATPRLRAAAPHYCSERPRVSSCALHLRGRRTRLRAQNARVQAARQLQPACAGRGRSSPSVYESARRAASGARAASPYAAHSRHAAPSSAKPATRAAVRGIRCRRNRRRASGAMTQVRTVP